MVGGDGQGLIAHRPHRAQLTAEACDDAQQRQALHPQVVEPVAATQRQRGTEFRAGARPIVVLEMGVAPAQAGQRLQLRFGGQLGSVSRDGDRRRSPAKARLQPWARTARRRRAAPRGPHRSCAGQNCWAWRRSPCAAERSPAVEMGERGGQAQPRDRPPRPAHRDRPSRAAAARGPRRGSARRAKRCSRSMSSASSPLRAACSRAGSGWSWAAHQRAVTACSPATRRTPWRCRSATRWVRSSSWTR